jgi:hypothetical protein
MREAAAGNAFTTTLVSAPGLAAGMAIERLFGREEDRDEANARERLEPAPAPGAQLADGRWAPPAFRKVE